MGAEREIPATGQRAARQLPGERGCLYQRPLVEVPAEQSVPARRAKIKPRKDADEPIAALSASRGHREAPICSRRLGA
jgi:hypothetical protein